MPLTLAFFLLALSWLLERSLEDLRLLALARCLLVGSSLATGDTDRELLSLEPERVRERVLRCSRATRFLLVFFRPRELERERERDGDRSSTILWVVSCGTAGLGGPSGSRTVTQVTVRSSEPKKVSQGPLSSSQGSGAGEVRPRLPVGSSSAAPTPLSLSVPEDGPREASASVSKTFSTV